LLAHKLTDPRYEHPKVYWVQVERVPDETAIAQLRAGVRLADGPTRPTEVRAIEPPPIPDRQPPIRFRKSVPTSWLELTIREGRNRQVRRMTAAVGFPTLRLIRAAIGPIKLGNLQPGDSIALSEAERAALSSATADNRRCQARLLE
jgi:23S rRNA pseudouridine2457 synthase